MAAYVEWDSVSVHLIVQTCFLAIVFPRLGKVSDGKNPIHQVNISEFFSTANLEVQEYAAKGPCLSTRKPGTHFARDVV